MLEENKALIRRWFEEVWNRGRADAIDEMFAADGVAHGLAEESDSTLRGTAGFKVFHRGFRDAFPDIVVTVEDTVAEGDKVVARCRVRGNHTGDGLGFAATHNAVEITGIAIARVEGGKIVESWNNFDFLKLYRQLGRIQ